MLAEKRVLITGAARGLGRAIALSAAKSGAKVAFTWHKTDPKDLEAELGPDALAIQGDVSDPKHARDTVKAVVAKWGGLDVLVNNAGTNQMYPLALIESDDWDEVMNVNVKGAFLFARAAAKQMIRQRSGRILNLGSFSSERFVESPIHYAAAKSALRGLTDALALEVGRYGVTVNLLAPGVLTEGMSSMLPQHRLDDYLKMCPAGRPGTYEEVAKTALFLVSDDNAFMTGAKIVLDGGL